MATRRGYPTSSHARTLTVHSAPVDAVAAAPQNDPAADVHAPPHAFELYDAAAEEIPKLPAAQGDAVWEDEPEGHQ
jgi:hypothetical protein